MRRSEVRVFALVVTLGLVSGCRTGGNYAPADVPRYSGSAQDVAPPGSGDTLRIASFNIAWAREVDSAIALLRDDPGLRGADVILLQEMDAPATQRIAEALRMNWVYYPAIHSGRTGRDFGNAVLARWPIVEDARVLLPHRSWASRTQRTATMATVLVQDTRVRLYSTHLATAFEVSGHARRDQLDAILDDARAHPRVVIGGDMNDEDVGRRAVERGYAWPTREGPRTTSVARWDHIFVRGVALPDSGAAGTVLRVRGASDHRPVWVVVITN